MVVGLGVDWGRVVGIVGLFVEFGKNEGVVLELLVIYLYGV